MDPSSHFALLVAINHYPGLSDLAGPENDAAAFKAWLLDKDGGRLDPARIVLIKSSDFDPSHATLTTPTPRTATSRRR
ncbi:MAG: caspase family protein [Comamonadaceae bacterium]|nr:caspase family protein [Comamonadaceae bacterium]